MGGRLARSNLMLIRGGFQRGDNPCDEKYNFKTNDFQNASTLLLLKDGAPIFFSYFLELSYKFKSCYSLC